MRSLRYQDDGSACKRSCKHALVNWRGLCDGCGCRRERGGGESLFTIGIPLPNVPQSTVLGHCLAAGFALISQLAVLQVTAPGVPDLPAATPHFVAHPVGSACVQLPEDWMGSTNQANKLKTTAAATHHYRHLWHQYGGNAQHNVTMC